jgi:hypothetical protein
LLSDFYVGKFYFANEVLFEGNLTELLGTDLEVREVDGCCLYDVSCQTIENTDYIEHAMFFVIEVFCDVYSKDKQEVNRIGQKIPGEKKLLISKGLMNQLINTTYDNHHVIQRLNNIAFYTRVLDNQDVYLTITANIEGVILNEPHENYWVCNHINMGPPMEDEVQDWKQLLNSINIMDMVSVFEHFLLFVKEICNNEINHINQTDKEILVQEKMNLTYEISELRKIICDLKKEYDSQSYIINGLLKIIKPL